MFVGGASGVGGAAGVEPGAVTLGRAQSQGLAALGVGQPRAGHDGLVVLQPGDAGGRGALHIAGQHRGEPQHHGDLRGPVRAPDRGRRWRRRAKWDVHGWMVWRCACFVFLY